MLLTSKIKYSVLLIFLLFLPKKIISQENKSTGITGSIRHPLGKSITIGANAIPISETGAFDYFPDIEKPSFFELTYSGISWSVYLEPNKKLEMTLTANELSAIEFKGELRLPNDFLLQAEEINKETNAYFNRNWVPLHASAEQKYMAVLDSLKHLFLNPLDRFMRETNNRYQDFYRLLKVDLNYGFNRLMIHYPEQHRAYTGERPALSPAAVAYIRTAEIDNPDYFDLPNYKKFTQSWIDYKADALSEKESSAKHYDLRKMDAVFQLVPQLFSHQILQDFWLSEFLYQHADHDGIANSTSYFEKFHSICKTEIYRKKIDDYYQSEFKNRAGHEIGTYKTANEFNLEAHIFYPENLQKGEKRPAIVIFHGGGWNSGKPDWGFGRAKHFADQGMVAVCAQYRLTNVKDITMLEAMADARDIIQWMRTHSDSLHILPDQIAAYGWSAGAHLASSAAIFQDSLSDHEVPSAPNALVLVSPAVSLSNDNKGWVYNVLIGRASVASVNPVEHVRVGLPPTIILEGREDTVTPLAGVQAFHDKMLENKNYCELWIYDNVGHLFTPSTMRDDGWPQPDQKVQEAAFQKADEFLVKQGYIKERK